jgi:hypothetical protein
MLIAAMLLHSCGGRADEGTIPSGIVAMYVSDDMSTGYTQVLATINKIDLLNTGSGAFCNVFTGPQTFDITNLAGVLQLVSVGSCTAVPYNRIHIEFAKSVTLTDLAANRSVCNFTSYMDNSNHPNILSCGTDTCTLDINGAVNVFANQQNKLALDFDLKNFVVDKISDPEMEALGHPEAITGLVSNLSTTDHTFTLTRGNATFSVLYSGITTTQQPGIDALLQRAQDDQLRVQVMASQIDCVSRTITASAIYVKVEGTIAAGSLNTTNHTFIVSYGSGKSIALDYSPAIVEGILAEGIWVEVKLYGFGGTNFLANRVEVEADGTTTED